MKLGNKEYVPSKETIKTDMMIRDYLKKHDYFDYIEGKLAKATDPNLKGPVPEAKFKCPECQSGMVSICKGTHGFYLYCVCDHVKKDECNLFIL